MAEVKRQQVEDRLEQVRGLMHTIIERPELLEAFPDEVFVPLDADLTSLFAPARLELLRQISRRRMTVGELARVVHRKVPSVSRDLKVLERRGLLRFEVCGNRKFPELRRSLVVLPLTGPSGKRASG